MDPPPAPRGFEQERGDGPSFSCGLCDLEQVHKISQLLLPGLAAACVDATTGDPFRGPASVAVPVRKDMVEYLARRSESHVAQSVLAGSGDVAESPPPDAAGEGGDEPTEVVSDFLDDFAASKRNLLGRVSGWLMSESREDKIDDFVQEMEANGFWLEDRREALAETLLKNLDYRCRFSCEMGFGAPEAVAAHGAECGFRPVRCGNEGCGATFSAIHSGKHDSACPFKILPCEQKCQQSVSRREMDRHCITVCPMRLVNCPFYQVGCRADAFPQCEVEQHCSEFLHSHLLYVLQVIHKQEATVDELKQRVQLLEKSQSLSELSEALDVRSLTLAIKEQEAKMKKLERDLSKVSQRSA
uniref:TNF receptor-associated factor family protein DDB_G0290965 n=1 Tax=Anthurium amnicola TaxID=1678845 RepID=A0A1D1XLP6_9ARAE